METDFVSTTAACKRQHSGSIRLALIDERPILTTLCKKRAALNI